MASFQPLFYPFLKRLLLTTSLLSVSLIAQPQAITGIFDAGWNSFFRDSAQWRIECERIAEAGMNTLILQYGISYPDHNYLEQSLPWATSANNEAYFERALPAAETAGLQLFLGLYAENDGWWIAVGDDYLHRQTTRTIELITLLEELFPSSAVIGYYIPHEIARYYWNNPEDLQRLRDNFLLPVTQHIHTNTDKKVLVSPFFNPDLENPRELQQFMTDLLRNTEIDIIAIQDGVGAAPKRLPVFGEYLRAVEAAAVETDVEFWLNIELFPDPVGDANNPPSGLPLLERIDIQLDTARSLTHCTKWISYDYSSLTSDHYHHTMNDLYDTLVARKTTLSTTTNHTPSFQPQLQLQQRELHLIDPTLSRATVALYNLTGKELLSPTAISTGSPIALPSLNGIAIARLRSSAGVTSQKLLFWN